MGYLFIFPMFVLGTPLMVVSPTAAPFEGVADSGAANTDASLQDMPDNQWHQIELERAGPVSDDKSAKRRGQARVSNTRCALVTCKSSCDIKGARDERGRLVYFTPVSPSYNRISAEQVFCSIDQARAAGYQG